MENLTYTVFPDFVKYSRLKSFEHWPNKNFCAHTLSEAGFFADLSDDDALTVFCFCCALQMVNFSPQDNPWHYHVLWSNACEYS